MILFIKKLPEDDPLQRKPDIFLAKKILNWEPKIKRKYGLIKTIENIKQRFQKKQKK